MPTFFPNPTSSSSSSPSVFMKLWHACAGLLISLPKKGGLVVYLPQGHLEEQKNLLILIFLGVMSLILSPIFPLTCSCRILDVKLHVGVFFFILVRSGLSISYERQPASTLCRKVDENFSRLSQTQDYVIENLNRKPKWQMGYICCRMLFLPALTWLEPPLRRHWGNVDVLVFEENSLPLTTLV